MPRRHRWVAIRLAETPVSEKRTQKAGDNSKQIQVAGDLVLHTGISEERARQIAEATARSVIAEYSQEANEVGLERIGKFDSELVGRLSAAGYLGAFADPAFQVLLRKAQLGAASTERESDYDMLARLLEDRVARGSERRIRAGVDRAVQIVDQVDESALVGLTVFVAATQFTPVSGDIEEGLDVLDQLHGQLLKSDLPTGPDWLDHLDVLDAVRLSGNLSLKKFSEFFPQHVAGYVAPGLPTDSEERTEALRKLLSVDVSLPEEPHLLKTGHSRISLPTVVAFETGLEQMALDEERAAAVRDAASDYGLGRVDHEAVPAFMEAVESRPNLRRLKEWWDSISGTVVVTSVGKVLARANAQRCDELGLLPPLD